MVSFVGKLSVVVVLLEGKMAAAFKFTMIAAVVEAPGKVRATTREAASAAAVRRPKKGNLASEHVLHEMC